MNAGLDEVTILRNALLDISTNRVNGKPTLSAGTAMLALAKARVASLPQVMGKPLCAEPMGASVSFLRLP